MVKNELGACYHMSTYEMALALLGNPQPDWMGYVRGSFFDARGRIAATFLRCPCSSI